MLARTQLDIQRILAKLTHKNNIRSFKNIDEDNSINTGNNAFYSHRLQEDFYKNKSFKFICHKNIDTRQRKGALSAPEFDSYQHLLEACWFKTQCS